MSTATTRVFATGDITKTETVQPLCDTPSGGDNSNSGSGMGPASSDSGSNTGQSNSQGWQEDPNWSVSEWHQHHNAWLRSNGEFPGHHHFGSSCISCHYSPGSQYFGGSETRGLFHQHHKWNEDPWEQQQQQNWEAEHQPFVTNLPSPVR